MAKKSNPKKPPPGMVDVAEDLLYDIESDEDDDDDFVYEVGADGQITQTGGPKE